MAHRDYPLSEDPFTVTFYVAKGYPSQVAGEEARRERARELLRATEAASDELHELLGPQDWQDWRIWQALNVAWTSLNGEPTPRAALKEEADA